MQQFSTSSFRAGSLGHTVLYRRASQTLTCQHAPAAHPAIRKLGGTVAVSAVKAPGTPRSIFHSFDTRQQRPATWSRVAAVQSGGADSPPGGTLKALGDVSGTLANLFPLWVALGALLGLLRPQALMWFKKDYVTAGLALTMLAMGTSLTFEDFKVVARQPKLLAVGTTLQYSIMPLLGFALSRLAGLPTPFAIGICIVASCPGGTASNVVTYLAKADVALSVALTTASTLAAVIATPLLTKALCGTLVPVSVPDLIISTLQVVLAPVLLGAALNTKFPRTMALLAPVQPLVAVAMVALICGSVIAQNASSVLSAGPQLLLSIGTLHAGGFALGYLVSRALGLPERAARTNSIEVGMQNSALGALLATLHFPDPLTPVPCAISACMHSIMGSTLAAAWRFSTDRAVVESQSEAQTWIQQWRDKQG